MGKEIKEETVIECPVCGDLSAGVWMEKFQRVYNRCRLCNHIFVELNENIIRKNREKYVDGTFFSNEGNVNYYMDQTNIKSMSLKLKWVKKFQEKGALLDIGAGFGDFLKVAQNDFDIQGVEISPFAIEWANKKYNINIIPTSVDDIQERCPGPYDVITMWDVIEHLSSWKLALTNIHCILKPGGFFFITTPDSSSPIARLLGKRWYHLHPMQHLQIFNRNNLCTIIKECGFDIVDIHYGGRFYNVKYILHRLQNFSSSVIVAGLLHQISKPDFLKELIIFISAHDIIGISARKRRNN